MEHKSPYSHVIVSSGMAGFTTGILANAIESIKTRTLNRYITNPDSRVDTHFKRPGMLRSAIDIVKVEGPGVLFRGTLTQCITNSIRATMTMSLYEFSTSGSYQT